jgi:WD40 repeat protein
MSSGNINVFCADSGERRLFAGNRSGELLVVAIDADAPRVLHRVQAHPGTIQSIVRHQSQPLLALLARDRAVSLWRHDAAGRPERVFYHSVREYGTEGRPPTLSASQAVALHATRPLVAARAGNGAVIELDYSDPARPRLASCARPFPEHDVAMVAYHGDQLLCGALRHGVVALLHAGSVVRRWQVNDTNETVHWFEPWRDGSYIVATDARYLVRLRPEADGFERGPRFARDDVEFVNWNPVSGRVFASSFDRNVYEIDPQTLAPLGSVFEAPFKVRHLKSLERDPDVLFVQVRDGSLYRLDLAARRVVWHYKETPPALWSSDIDAAGRVWIAGEGDRVLVLEPERVEPYSRETRYRSRSLVLPAGPTAYTKRLGVQRASGLVALGRTDGDLLLVEDERARRLTNVGSAVRDLAWQAREPRLFVATEGGQALLVDARSGALLQRYEGEEPLWSLAWNGDAGLLAVGERVGCLRLLDGATLMPLASFPARMPKRMRWLDARTLLVTNWACVDRLSLGADGWRLEREFYAGLGNTVEDFGPEPRGRYLVGITYNKQIHLWDLASGELVASARDQLDYTKGLCALDRRSDPSGYEGDFLTHGRSGRVNAYRIHDEQIMALGAVYEPAATPAPATPAQETSQAVPVLSAVR